MRRVLTGVLLVLSMFVQVGEARAAGDKPVVSGDVGRKMDEYLSRLEKLGFSGGALVVRGKDVLLLKSYGLADRAKKVALTTDSVYNLGSITKQFTAAAILTLEMQGKLSAKDPVSKYLDGVPADKASMTLHHLLTHSAGLESDFSPTDYDPVGREEYVRRALQSKLLFTPGDGYEYSNAGYSLLAAIVEKLSGQNYEDYLRQHVFKPAGMMETGYKAPAWSAERIAHGYLDGQDWGTIVEKIQPADAPYWTLRGNGGLHTTLSDMLAWHHALDSDAVLPKEVRARYMAPHVAEGPARRSFYAYGWAVSKSTRGTTVVQHNGGNGVFVAEFLRFTDEDAMIFLTSTNADMKATPVVPTIETLLFGGTVALPPDVVSLAPEKIAPFAGRWALPGGDVITLTAGSNALMLRLQGAEAMAAILPPPAVQADRYAKLSARTAEISSRAFAGDVAGLAEALGGARTIEELRESQARLMQDREGRLGKFKKSSVLGTVPRGGDLVQTVVQVDFEKGSVYNIYIWGPQRLAGMLAVPQLPTLQFVPTSATTFTAFSQDAGSTEMRLSFETLGGETVLVLPTHAGRVVAKRQK